MAGLGSPSVKSRPVWSSAPYPAGIDFADLGRSSGSRRIPGSRGSDTEASRRLWPSLGRVPFEPAHRARLPIHHHAALWYFDQPGDPMRLRPRPGDLVLSPAT